ncbi:MAG: hypothetical protein RLZZ574_1056 [Cyanobacteriota bacterium]|jgi:predicted NACHT family NTPase
MTINNDSSIQEEQTQSTLNRRRARQTTIKNILQFIGFPGSGIGFTIAFKLLLSGDFKHGIIVGILSISVTFMAIAANFIAELYNSVLDKIEAKLADQTEPLAHWIVNSLERLLLKLWWTLSSNFKGKYYQQLEYICRDYLTQGLDKDKILKLQKVFVPLKIATQDAQSIDPKQIEQQRKIEPLKSPPHWFQEKLSRNKCLVMLDGLDEVANLQQRKQVRDWVDEQITQYPDTAFILTSRLHGYESAPLNQGVTTLEVKPFSLEQMKVFLHNWYLQTEIMSRAGETDLGVKEEARTQAEDLIERIRGNKALADMAVNPLLLTMIATVHRRGNVLPRKRVELYKEICQVLLEKRQSAKNIADTLTASQKQSILQPLALALMSNNTREFQLSSQHFFSAIENQLQKVTRELTPAAFIELIKNVCGLLIEKKLGVYEFAHQSFQEYLAAVEITTSNQEQILIDNLQNSWWHETIRLYVAQSDATNIIQAALKDTTVDSMALAYDCLEEGLSVDAEVREILETKLEADLESR